MPLIPVSVTPSSAALMRIRSVDVPAATPRSLICGPMVALVAPADSRQALPPPPRPVLEALALASAGRGDIEDAVQLCAAIGDADLARRVLLTVDRPDGEVVPLCSVEDRIGFKARMGSEILTLILDSGATHVVLFHTPVAMAKTKSLAGTFGTIEGARRSVPTVWTADMFSERLRVPMLPAAIVQRTASEADGLVPASIFQQIHVDRTRGEIVLVRRP